MTNKAPEIENPDAPAVITLPPFLVLFALIAGIILNWLLPSSFTAEGQGALGGLGLLLVIICFAGLRWSFNVFKAADTNVSPHAPSTAIVEDGPYKYSRNPIYVCFLIGFTGLSLLANAPMMLLMIIPLFLALHRGVVIPEETYLTQKFGDTYTTYQKRIRRWV